MKRICNYFCNQKNSRWSLKNKIKMAPLFLATTLSLSLSHFSHSKEESALPSPPHLLSVHPKTHYNCSSSSHCIPEEISLATVLAKSNPYLACPLHRIWHGWTFSSWNSYLLVSVMFFSLFFLSLTFWPLCFNFLLRLSFSALSLNISPAPFTPLKYPKFILPVIPSKHIRVQER